MNREEVLMPTPLCQEALWNAVQEVIDAAQHIGDPWFPGAFVFTVTRNNVVVKDVSGRSVVELQKGRITVLTRPCIAVITKNEIELHQCAALKYAKGRWVHFSRYVVPQAEKEYYEASEIYEALIQAFRRVAGLILDTAPP